MFHYPNNSLFRPSPYMSYLVLLQAGHIGYYGYSLIGTFPSMIKFTKT